MYVLIVVRKLPHCPSVISLVRNLDSWVDPEGCNSWIEDITCHHQVEMAKQFPEFEEATFTGSIHKVSNLL